MPEHTLWNTVIMSTSFSALPNNESILCIITSKSEIKIIARGYGAKRSITQRNMLYCITQPPPQKCLVRTFSSPTHAKLCDSWEEAYPAASCPNSRETTISLWLQRETTQKHWGEQKNIAWVLAKPKQTILMCLFFWHIYMPLVSSHNYKTQFLLLTLNFAQILGYRTVNPEPQLQQPTCADKTLQIQL